MTQERIEKAIEIINYAIQNKISVKEASKRKGFADTYVKNIKAIVYEDYKNNEIDLKLFQMFDEVYKNYLNIKQLTLFPPEDDLSIKTEVRLNNKLPEETPAEEKYSYTESEDEAYVEWVSGSNYSDDHIKTLDELLAATDVDLDTWSVKDYLVNKWDTTFKVNGLPTTIQNFQVKARLEKILSNIKERKIGEFFREMIENYVPPVLKYDPLLVTSAERSETENNLLEITLFDLHIGKLAWGGETGENYDTKIARQRFLDCITALIRHASGFPYNRILFPIGSDFFNSDTIYNTTTKGTPQDEDLRWQKTFQVGTRLIIDAISMLKQLNVPIDVVVIPGNHDFERSFYMGEYLVAWYNNDPQVKVNNGASPRKYYRFGKVLLGLTHGSEEKEGALPLLMASEIESKPHWTDTDFHEWHVGHIHRKRDMKYVTLDKNRMTNEDLGVTVRYLSSLTGTEEWHHKKGFVGCTKAGEAFIWNDQQGMVAHLNANLIIK